MRWYRMLVFHLERFILRGAFFQLLLIAALIILVSFVAGAVLSAGYSGSGSIWDWSWWGFLRLSDPGYLGDDDGLLRRIVSTIVTILGYVLFMGALVAIMTQGLYRTISRLEAGLTPITENGHIVILGWNNRTPAIVREILLAEGRVKRFLQRAGTGTLNIVILAEKVSASLVADLKDELGPVWESDKIIFRSGNALRMEHLERVDFLNAAAIIVPASDVDSEKANTFDSKVMKILLAISNVATSADPPRRPPLVVTEIFDPQKADLARQGYAGDVKIIPSASIVSRLIAQNVRHKGLSHVYRELLNHGEGNEIYIRECPELADRSFGSVRDLFPAAIPIGILRENDGTKKERLNPPRDSLLADDRLVFVARHYDDTAPLQRTTEEVAVIEPLAPYQAPGQQLKILILGWGSKLPVLIGEFGSYGKESFHIDLMSMIPVTERKKMLERSGAKNGNVKLKHMDGDYTSPAGIRDIDLAAYTNVVFISSDWMASESESDARTILGYQLLRNRLREIPRPQRPNVLVELMDPENEPLFSSHRDEVLVTPVIVSHMMSHIALRSELSLIFENLFTAAGAEINFHPPSAYLNRDEYDIGFALLEKKVASRGATALGIFRPAGEGAEQRAQLHLNPAGSMRWQFVPTDEIVVLTTYSKDA